MKIVVQINEEGTGFDFGDNAEKFKAWAKKNPKMRMHIEALLPESKKQRRFYEGAVVPLVTFFQEGFDHKLSEDNEKMHNWLNQEFNPAFFVLNGATIKIAGSSKGKLAETTNKVIDWLEENYGIDRMKVLNPKDYLHWRDTIFPYGGPDNYVDFLVEAGKLSTRYTH